MKQPDQVELKVKIMAHALNLPLPRYMTDGAVGMDVYAAVMDDVTLEPGCFEVIPTGLQVAVPAGYELQLRPRSGLAAQYGISMLNSPGTVDADYRGEIKLIIINLGSHRYTIQRGDRIAQMMLCPLPRIKLVVVEELPTTKRGKGGFGHTG